MPTQDPLTGRTWLKPQEAAIYLGATTRQLKRWRIEGQPPPYHKRGKLVMYTLDELEEYEEHNHQNTRKQ